MIEDDLRNRKPDAQIRVPFILAKNLPLLDDVVGEDLPCQGLGCGSTNPAGYRIELGRVDGLAGRKLDFQKILDRLRRCTACRVSHARAEPDPNEPIEIACHGGKGRFFGNGVGENAGARHLQLVLIKGGIEGEDPYDTDLIHVQSEVIAGLAGHTGSLGIRQRLFQGDLQPGNH